MTNKKPTMMRKKMQKWMSDVYATESERKKLKDDIKRDLDNARQYKTADAKRKVDRLKKFLREVETEWGV